MQTAARALRNARVGIVGAGLAGSTAAHTLRALGFRHVRVYDRAKRAALAGGDLPALIAPNAMRALRRVELAAAVYARGTRVRAYAQTDTLDRPTAQVKSIGQVFSARVPPMTAADAAEGGDALLSVSRAAYADAALQSTPPDALAFEHELTAIRVVDESAAERETAVTGAPPVAAAAAANAERVAPPRSVVEVQFRVAGGQRVVRHFDVVVAADGALSAARAALFHASAADGLVATAQRLVQGVAAPAAGAVPFDAEELREAWGNGVRFGLTGLRGGLWQWYATLIDSAQLSAALSAGRDAALRELTARLYQMPDFAAAVVRATRSGALRHARVTYRRPSGSAWFHTPAAAPLTSHIALCGQAVAVCPPDLWQSAALSVESGLVLALCLGRAASAEPSDLRDAFERYRALRDSRVTAVITNALAEAAQADTTGAFATALRDMASGLMPKAARTALFATLIAHDPLADLS